MITVIIIKASSPLHGFRHTVSEYNLQQNFFHKVSDATDRFNMFKSDPVGREII